ncbi:hypothetical protein SCP_1403770 [Sparassis crispa]|uniref:Uncharacterized protein n=1 Tax=Sparassis crispa TaxID=139825 RepID=A0A401H3K7_9APHY|nr:hypothetical protein SCP_1403770 [Sparassis crispa]GBE88969.1 hypothetical protein SCP_1403770 [Sparassis crispa]
MTGNNTLNSSWNPLESPQACHHWSLFPDDADLDAATEGEAASEDEPDDDERDLQEQYIEHVEPELPEDELSEGGGAERQEEGCEDERGDADVLLQDNGATLKCRSVLKILECIREENMTLARFLEAFSWVKAKKHGLCTI